MKKVLPFILILLFACKDQKDDDTILDVIACFSYSPNEIFENDQIMFSNCSENANTYIWNFGDGNVSVDFEPTHKYSTIGTYTITLISSNEYKTDTAISIITIIYPKVDACYWYTPNEIEEGVEISFENCSKNANTFIWDFGDGNSSTDNEPTYTYQTGGAYYVTLIASNDTNTDTTFQSLVIKKPCDLTYYIDHSYSFCIDYEYP